MMLFIALRAQDEITPGEISAQYSLAGRVRLCMPHAIRSLYHLIFLERGPQGEVPSQTEEL